MRTPQTYSVSLVNQGKGNWSHTTAGDLFVSLVPTPASTAVTLESNSWEMAIVLTIDSL